MELKKKPCPWCGCRQMKTWETETGKYFVECLAAACRAGGPLANSKEAAVTKWNQIARND